ncbi:MAG: hypothetical protein K1X28_01790 [Parachlamydiales bacterium]|nr:hypothetical protein [Parachlamydiales bacterium]
MKVLFFLFLPCYVVLFANQESVFECDLKDYERMVFSEHGEDGIIRQIFDTIGEHDQFYVEFGAWDGHLYSNTKYLRECYCWNGLLIDCNFPENIPINLRNEFITAENVCDLFAKYNVPTEFDLLSIDIDYNDFYVWLAIAQKYTPRVVIVECNQHFDFDEDFVIKYDPAGKWAYDQNYGASILAFFRLGQKLGYSLVYHESSTCNLFFVRNDVIERSKCHFANQNDIYKLCKIVPGKNLDYSRFVSSDQILKAIQ